MSEKLVKILRKDLAIELWEFTSVYGDYFNRIDDKKIKKDYAELIYKSAIHIAKFRKMIYELELDSKPVNPINSKKLKAVLNRSLKAETKAKNQYIKHAAKFKDKKIKKMLLQIAKEEAEHEKIIKKMIKRAGKK